MTGEDRTTPRLPRIGEMVGWAGPADPTNVTPDRTTPRPTEDTERLRILEGAARTAKQLLEGEQHPGESTLNYHYRAEAVRVLRAALEGPPHE